jgi:cell wall integrity and stress response component
MSENSRYVLGTDGRQVVEAWEPADTPGSRRSRLMPVDQRLDPFAPLYQRGDGSKSRESINTIRDDQDYSRRVHQTGPILRATNPDE